MTTTDQPPARATTGYVCPDCSQPTQRRRRTQDARCDYCRSQVGRPRDRGRQLDLEWT